MTVTQQKGLLEYSCKTCETVTRLKHPNIIHTGFNETGFMYCKDCGKVVTWSCYDKHYEKILGQKTVPWALTDNQKQLIEKSVINCNCGGQFSFSARPRCLTCKTEIPVDSKDIHFYKLNGELNGDFTTKNWTDIWKK